MSDANVIHDASLTLKSLLEARLNTPGRIGGVGAPVTVTVDSPHRGNEDEFRINLFLYNVVQDEGRRNSGGWVPLERSATSQKFAPEPLALRLYYLVTAFASSGLTEHQLLGEAMQALYKHRRIPEALLKGTLKDSPVRAERVQLTLLNLDVDTLQKIWGSQTEPLRTSVAYEVEAVFLDEDAPEAEVRLVEERAVDVVPFPHPDTIAPEAAPPGAAVRLYGAGLLVNEPGTERSLVRVWFGDAEAEMLPDRRSGGAVSVRVPAGLKPGRVKVRLQLDHYLSRPVDFDVLEPA
ncbi:hypothetical protein BE04_28245 [Sorangium cellulosum]|uniref:Pvc16 N-terminal domain-containing protein n=2 Tax=Sorangium cellulosum TaxID=56 RepID=A0A150P601_SORCE|nr:DUF4255 domain-containing protein [Sorangium cellulosum]AGP37416.1 hypothetical protein SCE1572_24755 [Sorangium cellulosum So0157-2]KYF51129.1 hypothetical protein BE04_28245 [Sorangium cellulosum]KYG03841.1 hypothetical protein BE21_49835 [Sorangium cellulosum]